MIKGLRILLQRMAESRGTGYTTAVLSHCPPQSIVIVASRRDGQQLAKTAAQLNRPDIDFIGLADLDTMQGLQAENRCIMFDNYSLNSLLRSLVDSHDNDRDQIKQLTTQLKEWVEYDTYSRDVVKQFVNTLEVYKDRLHAAEAKIASLQSTTGTKPAVNKNV